MHHREFFEKGLKKKIEKLNGKSTLMVIYWLKKVWLNGFDQKQKSKQRKTKKKRLTKKPPKTISILKCKSKWLSKRLKHAKPQIYFLETFLASLFSRSLI